MNDQKPVSEVFLTFDIETSTYITGIENDNLIRDGIIWSGQFYDGKMYVQVRSAEQIRKIFKRYQQIYAHNQQVFLFVHNLSYEFQFIKNWFHWTDILATSPRRIISAECEEGFIFRCSYILTNMSLKKFLENEGVPVQKGDMDHTIRRLPSTHLSRSEMYYCRADVVGLHQAIERRISDCYRQSIVYLPLTSTGYVRRDVRRAVKKNHINLYNFKKWKLDAEQFTLCHDAFRGGNTHANRINAGRVCQNVASYDKASSYPFEMMTKKYPGKFFKMKKYTEKEFNWFYSRKNDFALLCVVAYKNIRLKDRVPMPYISTSRCLSLSVREHSRDNGRLLQADFVSLAVTEMDLEIIRRQYDYDEERFDSIYYSKKYPLPDEEKEVIMQYYRAKTELKGIAEKEYEYNKSKNRLNSLFGMKVTNPVRPVYVYDAASSQIVLSKDQKALQDQLDDFYNDYKSFQSYQHGVWITAYARYDLQELIDEIEFDDVVYCDTDSVKFMHPEKYTVKIDKINARIRREAADAGAVATDKHGIDRYMGVWENEGVSEYFKTFGAKKYIYGSDTDFKITISGVPKAAGADRIKEWMDKTGGKWQDLKKGFIFRDVKLTSEYHDNNIRKYINIDGERVEVDSNLGLYPANYTLGYASDYEQLLLFTGLMEDSI